MIAITIDLQYSAAALTMAVAIFYAVLPPEQEF